MSHLDPEPSTSGQSFSHFVWISNTIGSVAGTPVSVIGSNVNSTELSSAITVLPSSCNDITIVPQETVTNVISHGDIMNGLVVAEESELHNSTDEPQTIIRIEDPETTIHEQQHILREYISNETDDNTTILEVSADSLNSDIPAHNFIVPNNVLPSQLTRAGEERYILLPTNVAVTKKKIRKSKLKEEKPTRKRLSPSDRERIIDFVFNQHKTSREVARSMHLAQSTVMSVIQVFKKENRVYKKVATGRKRRLTETQEYHLYEISRSKKNISADEIKQEFFNMYPDVKFISKTTLYRSIDRGRKCFERQNFLLDLAKKTASEDNDNKNNVLGNTINNKIQEKPRKSNKQNVPADITKLLNGLDVKVLCKENVEQAIKVCRPRKCLAVAEREMIISLCFNERRSIRDISDFMHLAKSTVASVIQVFKREHRILKKKSTGRKKTLSKDQEDWIFQLTQSKTDATIDQIRKNFIVRFPHMKKVSKSTIYRTMESSLSQIMDTKVYYGTFIHATDNEPMQIYFKHALGVVNHTIAFFEEAVDLKITSAKLNFSMKKVLYMNENQFMIPGFIDTHTHACQMPNNGLGLEVPLLEWLQLYTFPCEAKFFDSTYAERVYDKVVARLIRNGTTTANYFASIHLQATNTLCDIIKKYGQRAVVGKTSMNRNSSNQYVERETNQSIMDVECFIKYVHSLNTPLIEAAINPRFAVTCTEEQLLRLGTLAHEYATPIHTHMSETRPELELVKELFPWAENYAHVYECTNLLTEKTILAHCIWLSETELKILREKKCGVAHCPNSNLSIRSGVCDVRNLLTQGIKVGLGTDCSAGYNTSILDSIRHTIQSSNFLAIQHGPNYHKIDYKEAFRLATLGGAKVLNLDDKIGNFEVGKDFDALLIDTATSDSPIDFFEQENFEAKIQQFLMCGDDRNIVKVFCSGRLILDNLKEIYVNKVKVEKEAAKGT